MRRRFDEDLHPFNFGDCDSGFESVGLCHRAGNDYHHNSDGKYALNFWRLLKLDVKREKVLAERSG